MTKIKDSMEKWEGNIVEMFGKLKMSVTQDVNGVAYKLAEVRRMTHELVSYLKPLLTN